MRRGVSLIELVLAIVVIAISVMSVPMMLQQGAKSDTFSMMQEAILAARTKMGNVLSYQWDDNDRDGNNTDGRLRVLDVSAGDPALDRNNTYYDERRIGHIFGDLRRKMMATPTFPSTVVDVNITDLNDFHGKSVQLSTEGVSTATDTFDYLDHDLNLTTHVYYISDAPAAGSDYNDTVVNFVFDASNRWSITDVNSTNIKMIELDVSSNNYQSFIFRTFSSNLGEVDLLEKEIN
ncbi:MAG: hypothetical protein DSZ05_04670 [Sulfurospirillum sp.]|nr:MAG: hypothetical protein DSZ05_04670 [Sulfurospirillum sp.]